MSHDHPETLNNKSRQIQSIPWQSRSITGAGMIFLLWFLCGMWCGAAGLAGQTCVTVADGAGPAVGGSGGASQLLPQECLWSLDVDDAGRVLETFSRASRLFAPRSPGRTEKTDVVGDNVGWLPYLPTAAAMVHILDLPYRDRMRIELAGHLARASGPAAVGLLPLEDGVTAPVMVFTCSETGFPPNPPQGLKAEVAGSRWILSTNRVAAERVRAHLLASGRTGASVSQSSRGFRLRLRPASLDIRKPTPPQLPWSILKYFVGDLPDELEVRWEPSPPSGEANPEGDMASGRGAGYEQLRFRGGNLARLLRPCQEDVAPRYIYCSLRLHGKVAMPEAIDSLLPGLMDRDPFRLGMTLLRAWPGPVPDRDVVARNLTGRFQLLVLHSSPDMVPVVGFELSSPARGLAAVERYLVATGLCDREHRDPIPVTFPLRVPDFLKQNRMLQHLFQRWNVQPPRNYLLAVAGGQLWMGPEEEVKEVLMALRDEGDLNQEEATNPTGSGRARFPGVSGDSVCGQLAVTPAALWDDLVFEHGRRARDNDFALAWERPLTETIGDLVKRMALQTWTVDRDGASVVLRRRTAADRSLLTAFAAYGYRAYRAVYLIEERIRAGARKELRVLSRAQEAYRQQHGRAAPSVGELDQLGFWHPGNPAAAPHVQSYYFGVAPLAPGPDGRTSDRSALFAFSLESGPGGSRPTYFLEPDGTLWGGCVNRADLARVIDGRAKPAPPRWQRIPD